MFHRITGLASSYPVVIRAIRSVAIGLALVGLCFGDSARAASSPQDMAMELATATTKASLSWFYTKVLFITNRKRNETALRDPKYEGNYDAYFTNTSDDDVFLGEACVAYPSTRRPAEQNYSDYVAAFESPAKFFLVKGFLPLRHSSRDLKLAMNDQLDSSFDRDCPVDYMGTEPTPALFIHGWRATFTSAITRGAQLKIDLSRKYLIVISWPADKQGRLFDLGYTSAEGEETKAKALVEDIMELITTSVNDFPSVIAHSMGARLYTDGIMSWFEREHRIPISSKATILAAPDIDLATFQRQVGTFKLMNEYTTVYCGKDIALALSAFQHLSPRLGYCGDAEMTPTAPEELVRVTGNFNDTWRHSYFLSSPQMISDMTSVLYKDERKIYSREVPEIPSRTLTLK
jgi:hypothetical protein